MNDNNLPLKIICDTKNCTNIDRETTRAGLESVFSLSTFEANEFLDGNVVFCRSVANDDIAQKYKLAFGRLGLKCTIAENSSLRRKTMTNLSLITDDVLADALGQPAINDPLPKIEKEASEPIIPDIDPADPIFNSQTNLKTVSEKSQSQLLKSLTGKNQITGLLKWSLEHVEAKTKKLEDTNKTNKKVEAVTVDTAANDTKTSEIKAAKRKNEAMWATNLIYIACFFYLLTAILDGVVEKFVTLDALPLPFPIFYLPLILGTFFVTLSCIFLVRLKGYPLVCAALGVTGPIGLGITLLLPDRLLGKKFKASDKHNSVGYFLIIAGLLWLLSPTPVKIDPQPFIQRADSLAEGRNIYPATTLDNLNELLPDEAAELRTYLNDGFELLKKVGNDEDSVSLVSEAMFREVSNLFQWLHYQRVLANQAGKDIYTGKGDDSLQVLLRTFMDQLQKGATRLGNEFFNQQITLWLTPSNNPPTGDMQLLYSDLVDTKLMFLRSGRKIDETFTLEDFQLPDFASADIEVKGGLISMLLKTDDPELNGTTVVVAFYPQAYTRRGIEGYEIMIEHIGGTLPNYRLPGWLNYFSSITN